MTEFKLDNTDVGGRVLAAIARAAESGVVTLSCRHAHFREHVVWDGIRFGEIDATGATFDRGLTLARCEIQGDTVFDRTTMPRLDLDRTDIAGRAYFRGAHIAAVEIDDVDFRRYLSFDEARLKRLTMREVSFSAEARFRQLSCSDDANLRRVMFATVASFQKSRWGSLRFAGCQFNGPAQMSEATVRGRLYFIGCHLADSRTIALQSGDVCELRETTFEQPLNLQVISPLTAASHASFEQGVDLVLSPGAELDLAGASLGGPSLIMTAGKDGPPARLKSLVGTRLAGLTLRGLDLSICSFARAHALDDVVISGRGQLSRAPWAVGWLGQREVIVDEIAFRQARIELRQGEDASSRIEGAVRAEPSILAETYRSLRRGRENAKDSPGAADFYYGEMEMRRRSAPRVDRVVLTAYWLISGYGLRVSRALIGYLIVVTALAIAMEHWGLSNSAPFYKILVYVLASTTVLQKPSVTLAINGVGNYLQVAARLMGPTMFALMLLALRSRVRR
jgi:uncharacterized protein YjbI with pentapeptide repeats